MPLFWETPIWVAQNQSNAMLYTQNTGVFVCVCVCVRVTVSIYINLNLININICLHVDSYLGKL